MTLSIYITSQYGRDYSLLKKRGHDIGCLGESLHGLEVLDSGSDVAVLHIHFGSHLVGNTYMVKLTDRKIT